MIASELTGVERDDHWPVMRQSIKSLATAEARTDRVIALVRLTPTPTGRSLRNG